MRGDLVENEALQYFAYIEEERHRAVGSLPGFSNGISEATFHLVGMQLPLTDPLKSSVRASRAPGL